MRAKSETNHKFEFMRILHLSDLHFPQVDFEYGNSHDKEMGFQSPQVSVLDEVYKIIDNVDFILISGDFTSDAKIEYFDKCLSFICEKFSHHNAKIFSVFGNHDLKRGCGEQKFTAFLKKVHEHPDIDFGGLGICEQRKLISFFGHSLDLLLINTCKNSSDSPLIPDKLEKCVTKPILHFLDKNVKATVQLDDEEVSKKMWAQTKGKMSKDIWDQIKEEIEKTTLIDDIYLDDEDYTTLANELANLESLICLSHYNLVSFSGSDKLNSFFSDQGKFRELFVNHEHTVVYLSGHTHTQECTVIENPDDYTNKLVCITAPPLFRINSSMVNGFNIVDVILRRNSQNIYKPVGCEVQTICANSINTKDTNYNKIRFSRDIIEIEFSNDERKVIGALKNLIKKTDEYIRLRDIIMHLQSLDMEGTKFNVDYLHEILMNLWWIGVIDEYSAMKTKNKREGEDTDYVGGVLCLPISY